MSDNTEENKNDNSGGIALIAAAIALILAAAGGIYYVMSGPDDNAKTESQSAEVAADLPKPDVPLDALMKTRSLPDKIMGSPDAPVTIVEYSSMTCPHCAHFHKETLPALKEKYIDTGKARYILREFPLDNLAVAAFMAARCVGGEKYFALVDALYAQQESWAYAKGDPAENLLEATKRAGAGFTKETFEACLQRQELLTGIEEVRKYGGETLNIRSTPSFFVNGHLISGSQPLEKFEELMKPYLK